MNDFEYRKKQQEIYNYFALKDGSRGFGGLDKSIISKEKFFRDLKSVKTHNILKQIDIPPKKKILDIGCNDGSFLNFINSRFNTYSIGMDISIEALKIAKNKISPENKFLLSDVNSICIKDNSIDRIFCFDMMEHLSNYHKAIDEIKRILKPGGKAMLYVISKKDKYTYHWFLRTITFNRLGVDKGRFNDHSYENFINPQEILKQLQSNNIKVAGIVYFHSFLTLFFDETIPSLVSGLYKRIFRYFNYKNIFIFYKLYSYILELILPLLEFIDRPISKKGYSNGFYLILEK